MKYKLDPNSSKWLCTFLLLVIAVHSYGQSADSVHNVKVGIYLTDLVDISGSNQSFLADVIIILTWKDSGLAGRYQESTSIDLKEIWYPQMLIVNQRDVKKSLPEVARIEPDGRVQYMQRYTGTYSAILNLRAFPLDRQRLNIWVVAPRRLGRNVNIEADVSMLTYRNDQLSISDWGITDIALNQREFTATANTTPAPGVELAIDVKRKFGYYIIQIIIPLLAIMLMAWAVFWIPPDSVNVRVPVAITTMLTLIAYRFALAQHVPKLSYLTRLDWFLLGATALVMLVLGAMAFSAYLVNKGKEDRVQRMDWYGRFVYPTLVIGFTLVVWLV